ncbi:hypothetical protein HNO89_000872 [Sporosarcina luteola]|nr:hypothetical protein [Sporosarcina luteola]
MEEIIVFGASIGGLNYMKNQTTYKVLAVADNDQKKQGMDIADGIYVILPSDIKNYNYDRIVVASMYIEGITEQLVHELNVKPECIEYAPKRLMKTLVSSFEDQETVKFAKKVLFGLAHFLDEKNYTYYLNFGTLLGIVREGRLLPWDDDIDITVLAKDITDYAFRAEIQHFFKQYAIDAVFHMKVSDEELVGIDIDLESEIVLPFTISIDLARVKGEYIHLPIDKIPSQYFEQKDTIYLDGVPLFAPYPSKQYLTYVYNDWETVKKNVSFMDNTTTYNEPGNMKIHTVD